MEDRVRRMQDFGTRVRYYRELRGLSLEVLGSYLGKTRASMSRIETGKQNLKIADIFRLADALRVAPYAFFPRDEQGVSHGETLVVQQYTACCVERMRGAAQALTVALDDFAAAVIPATTTAQKFCYCSRSTPILARCLALHLKFSTLP